MTTEPPLDETTVTALQGWHRAREEASRHNRNLLQYGAGMATVLGITAGSSGVFAIAGSLQNADVPDTLLAILAITVTVSMIALVVLGLLLVRTFGARQEAERQVDDNLIALIGLIPQRFLPKPVDART